MDLDALARDAAARLDPATAAFIARGADADGNRRALARRRLVPRSLVDVSSVDPSVPIVDRAARSGYAAVVVTVDRWWSSSQSSPRRSVSWACRPRHRGGYSTSASRATPTRG